MIKTNKFFRFIILLSIVIFQTNLAAKDLEDNIVENSKEQENMVVKITEDISFVDIIYNKKKIRIKRNQNIRNRLTNDYAKTSRECPPFCIQPFKIADDINFVTELEVLEFIQEKVNTGKGVMIDSRYKNFYTEGTIPGAINIPFSIFTEAEKNGDTFKILKSLNVIKKSGKLDFSKSKELLIFCNGGWCKQSVIAIQSLIKIGYPAEKLYWYRGGMQAWQTFGLTVIKP